MPRAQETSKKPVTPKAPVQKALPTTAEAALKRLAELKVALTAATEKQSNLDSERRAVQKQLDAAKAADNFTLAQEHLDKRNKLENDKSGLPEEIKGLREQVAEMHTHASSLYFAKHSPTERINVIRVTVVNPATGNDSSASYTDPSESIQLNLDGLHFESEAWHAESWAQTKGLFFNHGTQEVVV